MGMDDLAMDMETLSRILSGMKIDKEQYHNYDGLIVLLKEDYSTHPDYEKALNLIKIIKSRLS